MVRKIIQWVPIDGTRWRNEFVNGHENRGAGVHYGVAPGGVMGFIPRVSLPAISAIISSRCHSPQKSAVGF
jgi:hypothetical protein